MNNDYVTVSYLSVQPSPLERAAENCETARSLERRNLVYHTAEEVDLPHFLLSNAKQYVTVNH
jgi:hypothetical protein